MTHDVMMNRTIEQLSEVPVRARSTNAAGQVPYLL
jgi:hypothetical protein